MYERHGHSTKACRATRTYRAWSNMKERVLNVKHKNYKQYGARGITICERWLTFANFLADMGECPPQMTLDRIDNNGNYEPANCRWTTRFVQARNQRLNRFFTFQGETKCATDWAIAYGIRPQVLVSRLRTMPFEKALTFRGEKRVL